MNLRKDFPMLKQKIVYFDNAATTFKPYQVIEAITDYYSNYTANAHRGDYDISMKVDHAYESARKQVADFIKAKNKDDIIFNSSTTEGINTITNGFFKEILKPGDEILLTKTEHAANILPWYELAKVLDLTVTFIPLDEKHEVTMNAFMKTVTNKTKVVSLAYITNVIGDVRPIKEIIDYCHDLGIYVVVDAAQAVAQVPVNVTDLDPDFLVFSGHKMYGPTGVGVLYGKTPLLEKMKPCKLGGGMNASFDDQGKISLSPVPARFEGGTPHIAGVIGLGAAATYLTELGMDQIGEYKTKLKEYALNQMNTLKHIEIYNEESKGNTIIFNVKDVFSQDTAIYLNQFGICVRSGNHCAKITEDVLSVKNTCRISFGIYNTKSEIDYFLKALARAEQDVYQDII